MSGSMIRIEQFFKPLKVQQSKTEYGIWKLPQSQTRKIDFIKPKHPQKVFRFSETMLGN